MTGFFHRCAGDLGIPLSALDYSPESLYILWRWFLETARIEKTPKELVKKMAAAAVTFGPTFINHRQFTVMTQFILRDIGMYLGQCYVLHYPSLYWHYITKPRHSMYVNRPLIAGFQATYKGKQGDLYFEPVHMLSVQAAHCFDSTQHESDLYQIFAKWCNYIPELQETKEAP